MAKGRVTAFPLERALPPWTQGAIGLLSTFWTWRGVLAVRSIGLCLTALPLLLALPSPALAQEATPPAPPDAPPVAEPVIDFSADQVAYDTNAELVTAEGQVRMARDGNYLAADRVTWDRNSGRVVAEGNVVAVNPAGDKLIGDRIDLTDTLKEGTVENLLVVLESGGRIAAVRGTRTGDQMELVNAVYSACPVTTATGCPKNPSWKISAARVTRDNATGRIRFAGGRLTILGLTLPLLPVFSIGDGSQKGGFGGALEIKEHSARVTINNGVAVTTVTQVFLNTENRQRDEHPMSDWIASFAAARRPGGASLLLALLAVGVSLLPASVADALQYDRAAIVSGQLYRWSPATGLTGGSSTWSGTPQRSPRLEYSANAAPARAPLQPC